MATADKKARCEMCKAWPGDLQVDWEPRSRDTWGHMGTSPDVFVACVDGDWSVADTPCVGLRKRNAPANTMGRGNGRVMGACYDEKGKWGMGTQLADELEDAQPAWVVLEACGDKRAGRWWLLGRLTGELWPCALPLGTYNTKRKKRSPGLEKAAGERQAVWHWQTACLVGRGRDLSNWLPECLYHGELSRL